MNILGKLGRLVRAVSRRPCRATLTAACQSSGLVFRAPYAALVRTVLLASGGADLALLKRLLDEGGTVHNLHKLIYADMPPIDRSALLAHIQREAQVGAQTFEERLGMRQGQLQQSGVYDRRKCHQL